jgi:hypothetical protein
VPGRTAAAIMMMMARLKMVKVLHRDIADYVAFDPAYCM